MKKLISLFFVLALLLSLLITAAAADSSAGTYSDLQNAVNSAPTGIETKITLSADITDMTACLDIPTGKVIVIDLNGYRIDRNLSGAEPDGCVIRVASGAALTIQGSGMVTGGYNSGSGGGIYNAGTLCLTGGNVGSNTGTGSGGGIYNAGSFTMTGGMVSYNSVLTSGGHGEGGGVYNCAGSTFTLSCPNPALGTSGIINQNTADYGGGVYNAGTFALSGGRVKANTSSQGGQTNDLATLNPVQIIGKLAAGTDIRFALISDADGVSPAEGAVTVGYQANNPDAAADAFFHYDGADNYAAELQSGEITLIKTGDDPTPTPDPTPRTFDLFAAIRDFINRIWQIQQKIQDVCKLLLRLPDLLLKK